MRRVNGTAVYHTEHEVIGPRAPAGAWRLVLALAASFLLSAALPPRAARAAVPVQEDPALEAAIDSAVRRVVALIYDGQLDSAQVVIEDAAALAPGDPRIGLFRFRVLRENYPDDINEEERAQRLAPPILAALEQAIASADSILKRNRKSPAGLLYRGWGYMMKAQVHAIANQIWPAGSAARKGKGDLDRYLSRHPGDPDAGVIVGGYLYFADILPRLVKFIKFLVRIPAGDKDRGLELLTAGTRADSYTATDALVVLGVIDYMFEGEIDEASRIFTELADRYPYNPRVVELMGSTALIYPELSVRSIEVQSRVIDGWNARVRGWDDLFLYRLLWARARILSQIGEYEASEDDLKAIASASPPDPYWLTPRALLGLASLAANLGETSAANAYAQRVLDTPGFARYHPLARRARESEPSARQQAIFADLARARRVLFGRERDPEAARAILAEIRGRHGDDPRLTFLEGELDRQLGETARARAAYQAIVELGTDGGIESLRLMSLMRLGELDIAERSYDDAKEHYEAAQGVESGATLLGNMIRGRLRYIEEMKKQS
jgi:tetratricopeptide (TPR) repeat protein